MLHYLDYCATSPVLPQAAERALWLMREEFGNPSSLYRLGRRAEEELEDARAQVALAMGAAGEEVTFVSCGTEAANTALRGLAHKNRRVGRHLITTEMEHAATLRCAGWLESQGWEVTYLTPDAAGQITARTVEQALREDTALIALTLVNNEVGTVLPMAEIAALLRRRQSRALVYLDAVQGLGRLKLEPHAWGVAAMAVSGHKIGAPKGVGALYVKKGLRLPPLLLGGGQEGGRRSGTQAMPAIGAFGVACRLRREMLEENGRHVAQLRAYLDGEIARRFPFAVPNGAGGVPHVANVSFLGCKSEVALRMLSDRGVCISSGSSCSKGRASHVLRAMRLPPARIDSALRISFGPESTREDIDALLAGLEEVAARLRK